MPTWFAAWKRCGKSRSNGSSSGFEGKRTPLEKGSRMWAGLLLRVKVIGAPGVEHSPDRTRSSTAESDKQQRLLPLI